MRRDAPLNTQSFFPPYILPRFLFALFFYREKGRSQKRGLFTHRGVGSMKWQGRSEGGNNKLQHKPKKVQKCKSFKF